MRVVQKGVIQKKKKISTGQVLKPLRECDNVRIRDTLVEKSKSYWTTQVTS